jgi:RNA recognition motif-containing protein
MKKFEKKINKGFGFITFELEESANQVLQEHYIQFNGKQVLLKLTKKN